MKKILFFLSIVVIFLTSCSGVKTLSTGLENESFLAFIGDPDNYSEGVEVTIDDKTPFLATVKKDYAKRPKGNVYAVSTGTHNLTVKYSNKIIFKKQIFVSAQETKKILLP